MPPENEQNEPLLTGPNSVRSNVNTLMQPVLSPARKKAIMTLAKKHNISLQDAQYHQAIRISQAQARKK